MALKSANGIDYKDRKISIRVQEFDRASASQRPYEEDLVDEGLCADSLGDIPNVGDYIGLELTVPSGKQGETKRTPASFKVLSRYFSLEFMIDKGYPVICNIVVERVTDTSKLMKD